MSKHQQAKQVPSSAFAKLFDARIVTILALSAIGYYTVWASIYYLFGKDVATWLATPLWGIPVFVITRWDRDRSQTDIPWRQLFRFPSLRAWKVVLIVLSIFAVQFVTGYLAGLYVNHIQPGLRRDDWFQDMYSMLDLWGSAIIFAVGIISSYIFGGYLAGKLSPYRYLAPYSHAAVGSFAFVMISQSVFQFLKVCECGPPSLDDVGRVALTVPLTLALSLGGTWVATHTEVVKRVDALASAFSRAVKTQFSRNKEFNLVSEKPKTNSTLAEAGSIASKRSKNRLGNKRSKRSRHKGRKG